MEWLESLVLGVVQGVTEFLPISSDGHLSITQHLFAWLSGSSRSGKENLFFDVMLHLGTLVAILVYYREAIQSGVRGLLGRRDAAEGFDRDSVIRAGVLTAVAIVPLVPFALFFKKLLEEAFDSAAAAGYGFLVTAAVLLLTSLLQKNDGGKGLRQTTWLDALVIGLAQMFAPMPGVSRSGLTIAAALALGLSRAWAVGFSLLIAVPTIAGAVLFMIKDILKSDVAHTLTPDRVAQTVAATVVAGLVGFAAINWLVKVVRSGRLWYFSVYLIVLAAVVLSAVAMHGSEGDSADARGAEQGTNPLERAARRDPWGERPERGDPAGPEPLARPVAVGPRSDDPRPQPARARLEPREFGLLLG